jgi:hypothetical protein
MPKIEPPKDVRFTDDEALQAIVEAIRPNAVPGRLVLLPEILCAWVEGGLLDHLSREGRAVIRQRAKRLAGVSNRASDLLDAVQALDEKGRLKTAIAPQTHKGLSSSKRRAPPTILPWPEGIGGAELRRDEALAWLGDLIDALAAPRPTPPPDKLTCSYLVVLDLAAIFEFVTCTPPRRYTNKSTHRPYGPFWDFVSAICKSITEVKSLDRAIKNVVDHYPDRHRRGRKRHRDSSIEYSPWFANLQFRHPRLWQKMRRAPR